MAIPQDISWADYKDGKWYARGFQACVWLTENKVSYNDHFDITNDSRSTLELLSKGHLIVTLKDNQLYRPLSDYERSRFLEIKACQADIMRYGQPASDCRSDWLYPVAAGKEPPPHIRDFWPMD